MKSTYIPGIYLGSAQGFGGTVTVEVEVSEDRILRVSADVSSETQQLAQRPKNEIPQAILHSGRTDVDGVSGATVTSDAIKLAATKALAQAAGETPAVSHHTPGTYVSSVPGYAGPVTVETVLDASGIAGVRVLDAHETPGIGQCALNEMADRIAANGSLAVDGVSGATVTSAAIRRAAAEAIRQAGGDPTAFMTSRPAEPRKSCALETDVVVVGAGIAGYCAAIEALDQGARVLLLEKLDLIGGTAIVAGGAFMATNSYLNRDRGDESRELADWLYERQEKHYNVNYDQLLYVAENSGALVNWVREKSGVDFQLGYGGGSKKMWSHRPVLLPDEPRNGHGTPRLLNGLAAWFSSHGGTLLQGTRAEELILDAAGSVTGLCARSRQTDYTITAQGGVILCAGGYEVDQDMVRRFAPNSVHMRSNGYTAGDTGDGIRMGEKAGAQLAYSGYLMGSWNHIEGVGPFGLDAMNLKHKYPCIEVNGRMERFYNENTNPIQEKWEFAKDGTSEFYVLFDSSLPREILDKLDAAAEAGVIKKGSSVGTLATEIGKSPLSLEATVARWNQLAAQGEDLDFGNQIIAPLDKAPYYLCRVYEMSTGSYGGLKISLDAEVLGQDGNPIPGLYAAGETANGEFFYRNYVCGGSSFSMCGVFGRTAGRNAGQRAKQG